MLQRLVLAFNIRAGEGRLVSLLLIHSAFIGIANIFTGTVANALFIDRFGAESLPYIYIGVAIIVSSIGYVYTRLEARLPFSTLLIANLVSLFAVLILLWASLIAGGTDLPIIVLRIWSDVVWILTSLEFWGLAGRLFDLRQGKRLFGLIGAGDIAAKIFGGFAIGTIVGFIGTNNLLLVSSAAIGGSTMLLIAILGSFGGQLRKSAPARKPLKQVTKKSSTNIFKTRYAQLIMGLAAVSFFVLYIVDNAFFTLAQEQFPNTDELASFIGLFFAAANIVSLASRLVISGPLINRYGLLMGLMSLPVLMLLGATPIVIIGTLAGVVGVIFWLTTLTKLFDASIRYSIYRSASLILYQPLPSDQRGKMQTTVESVVEPIAAGATGLLLVLLINVLKVDVIGLFYIATGLILAWLIVTTFINREYSGVMKRALDKHHLDANIMDMLDSEGIALLKQKLRSSNPVEAVYALTLLDEMNYENLEQILLDALAHPVSDVRINVYGIIRRRRNESVLEIVRQQVHSEQDPAVRAAAIQTFTTIGTDDIIEEIEPFLTDPDHRVEHAALVGLLQSGGIEGIMVAGQRVFELMDSTDVEERVLSARVLGDSKISGLFRPLSRLLSDDSLEVQREAINAAGNLKSTRLWDRIVQSLSHHNLAQSASRALISGGTEVIPYIDKYWPSSNTRLQVRMAHIVSLIGGSKSVEFLRKNLFEGSNEHVRTELLTALSLSEYQPRDTDKETIHQLIRSELDDAAWALTAAVDLHENETMFDVLQQELRSNENRLFLLLSLAYDRQAILRARDTLFSAHVQTTRRAYALEIIDMIVPKEIGRKFIPMLDETMTVAQRLERLNETFPQQKRGHDQRLGEIITLGENRVHDWTIATALDSIATAHLQGNKDNVVVLLVSDNKLIRESATRTLYMLFGNDARPLLTPLFDDPDIGPFVRNLFEDTVMLSTIEKVFALKGVEIFSETPENALVAIADIMEEIDLEPGELLFEKGDVGSTLYIIFSGEMRVHDGDTTLAIRKDGDVFGEINLLDTQTRTASLSAVNDVRLLRLEQEPFFEIMAHYPAVSRAIIRMLAQRLREATDTMLETTTN